MRPHEAGAKRRLADEYDAAQERGEVQTPGGARNFNVPKQNNEPTVDDIGLTRKEVHEARLIRDAEIAEPGIVRLTNEDKRRAVITSAIRSIQLLAEFLDDLSQSAGVLLDDPQGFF